MVELDSDSEEAAPSGSAEPEGLVVEDLGRESQEAGWQGTQAAPQKMSVRFDLDRTRLRLQQGREARASDVAETQRASEAASAFVAASLQVHLRPPRIYLKRERLDCSFLANITCLICDPV